MLKISRVQLSELVLRIYHVQLDIADLNIQGPNQFQRAHESNKIDTQTSFSVTFKGMAIAYNNCCQEEKEW